MKCRCYSLDREASAGQAIDQFLTRIGAVMESFVLLTAVFAPFVGAVVVSLLTPVGLRPGRIVAISCGVASVAALTLLIMSGVDDNGLVGDVGGLDLRLERSSAILLAVVAATGVVVASFARRNLDVDPRSKRFFVLLGILVTGSSLVVVPGGAAALLVGWSVSTWALLGLVGHRSELAETRQAQRRTARALIVGDVALLAAVLVAVGASSSDATRNVALVLGELQSSSTLGINSADLVAVLLVVAGASRSALVPFHRWLVATLAAPTPVSALVHAGFVSGAGLLAIRFGPLLLESVVAVHLAFALAVTTVLIAVGATTARVDVKGKLAWSTVAQMGFMVVQCTVGAFSSAVFHIAGHGMYKASMFLGAGDAISAHLRSARRTAPVALAPIGARFTSAVLIAIVTVVVGMLAIPPDVSDGGVILIAVFSWLTVANGVWGWLGRGVSAWPRSAAEAALGALAATFAYLSSLRAVEAFVKPTFGEFAEESGVRPATLLATLTAVAVGAALWQFVQSPVADWLRGSASGWITRIAHPAVAGDFPMTRAGGQAAHGAAVSAAPDLDTTKRSQVRADVSRAGNVIAPTWPLTSFVAVNPLGGLEQLDFDSATAVARQQLRARTHLSLDDYRREYDLGLATIDDLRTIIATRFADVCEMPGMTFSGRELTAADVIEADMLHGPEVDEGKSPCTAIERLEGVDGAIGGLIDDTICFSVAQYIARADSAPADTTFVARALHDAKHVGAVRKTFTGEAITWLQGVGTDRAGIINTALAVMDVDDADRVAELRGQLSKLQGWAGYAKWRTEWAHADEARPTLALIDLVAARCALEAACLISESVGASVTGQAQDADINTAGIAARLSAAANSLGVSHSDSAANSWIAEVVSKVSPHRRHSAWLAAQERCADRNLLSMLDRSNPDDQLVTAAAQLVFCIDVRSEGLRRHIEAAGPYDTLGFAGFFGAAMAAQRIEWQRAEARCPVLVAPGVMAIEHPTNTDSARADIDRLLGRDRRGAGAKAVHAQTKYGAGAPYVMAEAAGWIAGPLAAARTLLPSRTARVNRPPTVMELERGTDHSADVEQRTFLAEAVLRTMGLIEQFAPLVVVCGHSSANVNNPHTTSLDCGACAGASGQDNARTVAALLNDVDVRLGLGERGIDIPDGTHFAGGLHETVSDTVEILDRHLLPATHLPHVDQLIADLATAGRQQSTRRAADLPGPDNAVRRRGSDWAQVRPEWGLARNSAFIIGQRSMTAGVDLGGRAFLHNYDADSDPDGKVLETIMTAPLVVAHWISSQYYFSTVDPDVLGAGDKLIHNVVAETGVIAGEGGDLRVGLPYQSTHVGSERHHQPIRLIAVVQAPLERIDRIIEQNAILATLTSGSWMRVAGRSHAGERWSLRTPQGSWTPGPRTSDLTNPLETS